MAKIYGSRVGHSICRVTRMAALSAEDLMESIRRESVNLSGTTADRCHSSQNLRTGGVFIFVHMVNLIHRRREK